MNSVVVARVAAIVIAAIATARCMMTLLGETWFDVDPAVNPSPAPGLPPHWLMIFDAALLGVAAIGLAAESWGRRGGSTLLLILLGLPFVVMLYWIFQGGHHVQAGVPWLAGMTAAVTLSHLCRDPQTRTIVLAILFAVCGPLILQGLVQWGWTAPDTIAWFEANREEAMRLIGLTPGSPAAQVYERRLYEGAASGWFSSPNLLATVLAACGVAWLAMLVAAKRRGASVVVGAIALVATLACAAVVGATMSTGGMLVLAIGLVLVGVYARTILIRRVGGLLAVGIPLAAAVAVIVIVLVLPADTTIPGMRSMVIRGQYVQGAAAIVMEHPSTGVGPAGFQDAWVGVRPIGAPEEVTSPHAMVFDWIAMLGLAGVAWVGLVGALLWRAGTNGWSLPDAKPPNGGWVVFGGLFVIGLTVIGLCEEWTVLDPAEQFVRVCGLLAVPLLAWVSLRCLRGPMAGWGVTAAIVVLLTQAQIEMTMFNSATAVFVLALLGAAAPWRAGVGRAVPAQLAAIVAIMCVVVVSRGVLPWTAQDRAVTAAAQILIDAPESADARDLAGHAIAEAWSVQRDPRLLVHAADQYLSAAATPGREQGLVLISLSLASGEGGWAYKQGLLAGGRRKLEALDGLAVVTGNPEHTDAVLVLARELANRDPGSVEAWVTLARFCQRAGLDAEAAEAWSRAIDVDEANVIDLVQRLPEAVRREATDAIAVPAPR